MYDHFAKICNFYLATDRLLQIKFAVAYDKFMNSIKRWDGTKEKQLPLRGNYRKN